MAALDELRDRIRERAEPLIARLDPLRDRWERASQRDRTAAMILAGVVALIIISLGAKGAMGSLSSLRSSISSERNRLERVEGLAQEYVALNQKVERLKRNTINTPVSTYVEQTATKEGIVELVGTIQNQRSDEGDFFLETVVEVRIKKISLKKLTAFMHALEQSGKAARVQSLVVKPTFQDPRYLDVTMEVIGYRPLNSGGS